MDRTNLTCVNCGQDITIESDGTDERDCPECGFTYMIVHGKPDDIEAYRRFNGMVAVEGAVTRNDEHDPDGIDPHQAGAKLDAGKAPVRRGLLEYFPRACMAVSNVSQFGANKYSWGGWKSVKDGVDRYGDAEVRHICKAAIEGPKDSDSGLEHKAHEAWNALAALELALIEEEKKNADSNNNT